MSTKMCIRDRYRDGEQVSYVNEMLIQASGSYEMRVFSSYGEDQMCIRDSVYTENF